MAKAASPETRARIAAGVDGEGGPTLDALIHRHDCRLSPRLARVLHPALLLAAAIPDDDFPAFTTATAILVADRLRDGAGADDLFWHWDAFQAHYRMLSPPDRAAIMQGFFVLNRIGRVALFDPPTGEDLLSRGAEEIRRGLLAVTKRPRKRTPGAPTPYVIASFLARQIGHEATARVDDLWQHEGARIVALPEPDRSALIRGFRYFFESGSPWILDESRTVFVPIPLK